MRRPYFYRADSVSAGRGVIQTSLTRFIKYANCLCTVVEMRADFIDIPWILPWQRKNVGNGTSMKLVLSVLSSETELVYADNRNLTAKQKS